MFELILRYLIGVEFIIINLIKYSFLLKEMDYYLLFKLYCLFIYMLFITCF